jgi:hypothetical protein
MPSRHDDHEWLRARERGDDVSQVPAAERERYRALEGLIAALPARTARAGWKQRVLAAVDQAPAPAPVPNVPAPVSVRAAARRWPIWIGGSVMAAAAATAVLVAVSRPERATRGDGTIRNDLASGADATAAAESRDQASPRAADADPSLARVQRDVVTEVVHRGERRRGGDAAIGDSLALRIDTDGSAEIRIYGDAGEPIARCDDFGGCEVERDGAHRRYTLLVPLRAPGDVRAVLFTGGPALPPPRDLDTDLAVAAMARITARQIASQRVQ